MKKRRFMITGIFVLVGILLIPIYLRSEAFHRFYDRRLRTRYLKNIHNDGEWIPLDHHTSLEETPYFYDICAVVKVTDGMEDSLGEKWRKDPKQIWDASYEKINVEVEEYVFDKTGNYFETLVIRALPVTVWADAKQWRKIYAYTGERLFLFITVIGSGLCQAETTWGYIITGNDYLVPLTDGYSEEMNSYGGRKVDVYKEDLLEEWETYQAEKNYERAICHAILQDYIKQEEYLQVTHGFWLSKEEEKRRYVIRHILFGRGVCRKDYRAHFGSEAEDDFPLLSDWAGAGYAVKGEEFFSLTRQGLALSDFLGPQLISDEVREKMKS